MALTKDLGFGPDEQLVRDQARKLLRDTVPVDKLRTLVARDHHEAYETKIQPASWDEGLWKQMVELGWTALSVPESAGGLGMKTIVSVALAEELGRVAVPSPLPATLAATAVLKAAGATSWLEKIAGGEAATLAITPESGSWEPGDTDVEARAAGGGVTLHGKAAFVQDARKARLLVVAAKSPGGVALYVVPVDAPGVTVTPDRIVDLTRDQATVSFDGVPVDAQRVAAGEGKGKAALAAALEHSYIDTMDCPELCGLRHIDDVLDSHRSTGTYDPTWWYLVRHNAQPAGAMLLNRCPEMRSVELVYLGLGTGVRGKGLGSRLLRMGMNRVHEAFPGWSVTCAVDARNAPALALYESLGFAAYAKRGAYVRSLGVRASQSPAT